MRLLSRKKFVGEGRGFKASLPRDQSIADMFTYLQNNYDFKNILEFGFNKGHSATWFLEAFPNANLKSYDPKEITFELKRIWLKAKEKYGNRFSFDASFSDESRTKEKINFYDIIFIDGGHTFGTVLEDIKSALILQIPVVLIDNMELEDQQRAINYWKNNLDFVREFEYYTKNNDGLIHRRTVNLYHVRSYDIREPI